MRILVTGLLVLYAVLHGFSPVSASSEASSGRAPLGSSQIVDAEAQLGLSLPFSREYKSWPDRIRVIPGHTTVLSVNASGTPWARIASGAEDARIRAHAADVRAIGHLVYLAFQHEPEHDPNGTPAQYRAAWRHYVAVYQAAGVRNVRWTWILTANAFNNDKADSYYPGDDIVQVVAADGYNWVRSRAGARTRTFAEVFDGFHQWAQRRGKPALVAEFGMVAGAARAQWIADAARTARAWGFITAIYWNSKEFRIGPDAVPALRAWAAG